MPIYTFDIEGKKVKVEGDNQQDAEQFAFEEYQRAMSQQQVAPVAASLQEQPGMLAAPLGGGDRTLPKYRSEPESDKVALDSNQLTKEFQADYKIVTGEPVPLNARTPRQALDAALAKGTLDPSFVPSQDFGAFASQWEPYLRENKSDIGGAFLRGVKSSPGGVAGGYVGAGIGQVAGIPVGAAIGTFLGGPGAGTAAGAEIGSNVGALGGGFVGGVLGDYIYNNLLDSVGLMTDQDKAKDKFDQDQAATRWARMIGEATPQLAGVSKFAVPQIKAALAGEKAAQIGLAAGGAIGAAAPVTIDAIQGKPIDFERATMGVLEGVLLQPRSNTYFDRAARTEISALRARNATLRDPSVTTDIPSAVQMLQLNADLNQNGVNLGAALTGQEGLISLENALFNQDQNLRSIRQKSFEQIAKNIDEPLRETGARKEDLGQYFNSLINELMATSQRAYDDALRAGNAEMAAVLREAQELASAGQRMAQDGLIGAETAYAKAFQNFRNAQRSINEMMGKRAVPSALVLGSLEDKAKTAKAAVQEMATFNGKGVLSDLNEFSTALKDAKSKVSRSAVKLLPSGTKDIIDRYTPKKNPKTKKLVTPKIDLETMVLDTSLIADEIRSANKEGNTTVVKFLTTLKSGIERDIDAAANTEDLRAFRDAYREYARKYLNETSHDVLVVGSTEPTKVIDAYMQSTGKIKGTSGARQLRDIIDDDPLAIKAVGDWFINQMAEAGGTQPKSETLRKWLASNDIQERLALFPEAAPRLKALIDQLESEELAITATELEKKAAQEIASKPESFGADRMVVQAKEAQAELSRKAAQTLSDEQKLIQQHDAIRFIKQEPLDAVTSVFASKNPVAAMESILEMAAKDPTGNATQGVKNAVRDYLNREVRGKGAVAATKRTPAELDVKDLDATLNKINSIFLQGSTERKVLETVFGHDSPELNALALAQRQLDVLQRKGRATKGMSATEPQRAMSTALAESIAFNSLNFFGRVARGYDVERALKPGPIARTMDLVQRAWSGDVRSRTIALLQDALLDPNKLTIALTELTPSNLPKVRSWLKMYDVPYAFDPETSSKETLGNGAVVTDNDYGFRMTSRDNKRFRVYYPTGKLMGVYDSADKAQQATDNEILKARKQK